MMVTPLLDKIKREHTDLVRAVHLLNERSEAGVILVKRQSGSLHQTGSHSLDQIAIAGLFKKNIAKKLVIGLNLLNPVLKFFGIVGMN